MTDQRVVEENFDFGTKTAGVRAQFAKGIAHHDLNRLEHLNESARGGEFNDPGTIDGVNENSRAAVHDRYFGAIDFDGGVVDTKAAQRCENVLGG